MGKKKVASLTGSLLTQDKTDPSTGFVISLVDRLKESQAESERQTRGTRRPRAERSAASDPSVDIVDSIRPRPPGRAAGQAKGPPRQASSPADQRPEAHLGEDDDRSAAQPLVQALRNGELARAEELFGRLTGLTTSHVRRVLYGGEGRNLAIACRALGIEQLQFVSIFMLSRRLGLGERALEPRKLTQIVSFFDQTEAEAARKTLKQWLCYSAD